MIEESVHRWLNQKQIPAQQAALVVQLTKLPEDKLSSLTSVGDRIKATRAHVAGRLAEVCGHLNLPEGSIEVMGAGDAVIRASPDVLRVLVANDGPLAKADDLSVKPNEFMSAVISAS